MHSSPNTFDISQSKSDRLKQWGSQWFPVSGTQLGFSSVRVQLLLDKRSMLEDSTLGSNCPGANSWGKRNGFALRGERGTLNIEPLVRVDPGVNVLPNTFIKLVPRQDAIPFFACNPLYHMFPH